MIINGKDVVVYIYDNGAFRLYGCATSATINHTTTTVETSTTGSGTFSTIAPQKNSWGGTIEGLMNLGTAGQLTIADLVRKQFAFEQILINFEASNDDGYVYVESGFAFITGSSINGSINSPASFNVEFIGNGVLTQTFDPTPLALSAVRRYQATASGGETLISVPSLIGKDILSVVKDGLGNCLIITSGVPVANEVLYDFATGDFSWASAFDPGGTFYILYQDVL